MKTACILTTLIASAAAFAPTVQQSKTLSSALNADAMEEPAPAATVAAVATDFTGEVGAQAPLGFWDPMSFLGAGEQTRFDRLREVEIKHGRIS